MKSANDKLWLVIEFTLFFIGAPLLLYFDSLITHPSSVLLPLLVGIILILRYRTGFQFRELIKLNISRKTWIKHGYILILIFAILFLAVKIFIPEKLFNLPKGNFWIWIAISVFYPVFSAFAQEVIYRTFIYRRYSGIFSKNWIFILASATVFSYVHIVYYSPVSIILTFFGGLYLAKAYIDTKSVLFTSILHGLMGNIVFAIGLGEYFWLDMLEYI